MKIPNRFAKGKAQGRGAKKRRDALDGSDGCMKSKGREWPRFHSTFDIIEAVEAGRFPDKAMITVHPQRWTDDPFQWTKELVWQNVSRNS